MSNLSDAVEASLASIDVPEKHRAVADLARFLAETIDSNANSHAAAKDVAPKLLATLTALGLTPAATNRKDDASADGPDPREAVRRFEIVA